jgi:hypothetical protein
LLQFLHELGFKTLRIWNHLASRDLLVGRSLETQFACSQTFFRAHWRTEHSASHRPVFINLTKPGAWVEGRTRLVVREILEAFGASLALIENAALGVSGKFRRQPGN